MSDVRDSEIEFEVGDRIAYVIQDTVITKYFTIVKIENDIIHFDDGTTDFIEYLKRTLTHENHVLDTSNRKRRLIKELLSEDSSDMS